MSTIFLLILIIGSCLIASHLLIDVKETPNSFANSSCDNTIIFLVLLLNVGSS